eukprot:157519-Pleurochrysis_carterae.AAC.1
MKRARSSAVSVRGGNDGSCGAVVVCRLRVQCYFHRTGGFDCAEGNDGLTGEGESKVRVFGVKAEEDVLCSIFNRDHTQRRALAMSARNRVRSKEQKTDSLIANKERDPRAMVV